MRSVVDSTPYSRITEHMVQDIVSLYRCHDCIRFSEDLSVRPTFKERLGGVCSHCPPEVLQIKVPLKTLHPPKQPKWLRVNLLTKVTFPHLLVSPVSQLFFQLSPSPRRQPLSSAGQPLSSAAHSCHKVSIATILSMND